MSNNKSQEIFKFTALRGPVKYNTTTYQVNTIKIPATIPFVEKIKLQQTAEFPIPLTTLLKDYTNSEYFYKKEEDIWKTNIAYRDLFYEVIQQETYNKGNFVSKFQTLAESSIADFLADANNQKIKDIIFENYIVQALLPANSAQKSIKDSLAIAIKFFHLLDLLANHNDLLAEQIQSATLINATIILPDDISYKEMQPEQKVGSAPSKSDITEKDYSTKLYEDYNRHSTALEELTQFQLCKNEMIANLELKAPTTEVTATSEEESENTQTNDSEILIDPTIISNEEFHAFSDTTQGVINSLTCPITKNIRLPFIIGQLNKKLSAISVAISKLVLPYTETLLAIGGNVTNNNRIGANSKGAPEVLYPNDYNPTLLANSKTFKIADLKVVQQQLLCCQASEIAHIENILQGEYKNRKTRRLTQVEETSFYSIETEKEEERDLQTTERFEMNKASSSEIQKDIEGNFNSHISASYAGVKLDAGGGFSSATSQTQSDSSAMSYAREITERARKRIVERIKDERTIRTKNEFEESNEHGIDNKTGTSSIVGIYRWVDKIYLNRVTNYGKRLMFEFMVPEPAAFHIFAMKNKPLNIPIEKPINPKVGLTFGPLTFALLVPDDVTELNYLNWASVYGAEVNQPPAASKIFSLSKKLDYTSGTSNYKVEAGEITLDVGYAAKTGTFNFRLGSVAGSNGSSNTYISGHIGNNKFLVTEATLDANTYTYQVKFPTITIRAGVTNISIPPFDGETGKLPYYFYAHTDSYGYDIEIVAERTDEHFVKWQIDTFNKIMQAYQNKLAEYENAKAQLDVQAGIQIKGQNPALNRETERRELKKAAIQLFLGRPLDGTESSMQEDVLPYHYPEFDAQQALDSKPRIDFFETAFEWEHMSYTFYPYFWGNKKRWQSLYTLEDTDPIFNSFLQAGAAKVIVPVCRNFEKQVLYFIESGMFFDGSDDAPVIHPDHQELLNDLNNTDDIGSTVGGEEGTWQTRIPTNLVILQTTAGTVDGDGLPCKSPTDIVW